MSLKLPPLGWRIIKLGARRRHQGVTAQPRHLQKPSKIQHTVEILVFWGMLWGRKLTHFCASVRPSVRAAVRPDTFGDSVFENFKSIVFFGEFFVQSPSKSLVATLAAAEMGAPFGLQNATCHISGYTNGSFAWSPQCYLPHWQLQT